MCQFVGERDARVSCGARHPYAVCEFRTRFAVAPAYGFGIERRLLAGVGHEIDGWLPGAQRAGQLARDRRIEIVILLRRIDEHQFGLRQFHAALAEYDCRCDAGCKYGIA
jgi:hypothetical protein